VDDPIAALDAAQQDEAMQTENAEGARLARDSPLGNVAKQ